MSGDNPSIDDVMRLIRVQSMVRGFLQRRAYRIQKLSSEGASKYFKIEEANETLGKNQKFYKDDAPLEERTHTYQTGAVYEG